jgi:predicted aspartyl protease
MRKPMPVLFVLVLVPLVLVGSMPLRAESAAESQPLQRRGSSEMPMRLYGGFLIVAKGRIGARDNLNFVLDTGATHSIVDSHLAAALQLPPSEALKKKIISFDAALAPKWAEVVGLQFGPILMPKLSVVVGDLSYFQTVGARVDALIGLDVLRGASFTIDYARERVAFGPDFTALADAHGRKIFQTLLRATPACFLVELRAGDQTLHVIVDTGAAGVVLYEDHLAERAIAYRVKASAVGAGVGGGFVSSVAALPSLAFGGRAMKRQVFLTRSPGGVVQHEVDGFLGLASLHARRVTFDLQANTLTWSE